jgi:hypothetical protein
MELDTKPQPERFYDGGLHDRSGVPLAEDPPNPDEPERVMLNRRFESGKEDFRLERRIAYLDRELGELLVPNLLDDWETDLTSVPGLLTWLVPKSGRHLPAALIHDGLVPDKGNRDNGYRRTTDPGKDIDRIDADRVFRDAMRDTDVGLVRRWLVWAAVANASLFLGARAGWVARTWWYRVVIVGVLASIAYFGLSATLEVFDVGSTGPLPWMGDLPWIGEGDWPIEVVEGLAGAVVIPLLTAVLWGRRYYLAGAIAGVAIATLLHATVAAGLVTAGYWVAELVARSLWLRLAVATVVVAGAVVVFVAALLG